MNVCGILKISNVFIIAWSSWQAAPIQKLARHLHPQPPVIQGFPAFQELYAKDLRQKPNI